jgi:hypothetical protein
MTTVSLALRNWKLILIGALMFLGLLFFIFFATLQQEQQTDIIGGGGGEATVSPLVRRYEPLVRAAAEKYGVPGYVELLLAKMMQESGGRLPDVMQSSESIGLPRNAITNPAVSIDVGVRYFASVLKKAGGDVKLALQSYNMGTGFIDYAKKRGGYSKAVAIEFSNMMAAKMGWSRYGDVNYVDNVLRYYKGGSTVPASGGATYQAVMKEALKYKGMPYQWGGASPSTSFDCSGLWVWSFKQIGINLPRTAQEQYNFTERISASELQVGDFIFFTGTADHAYISHVGIYTGNGQFYNSNSKGVGYSKLEGYWERHVAGYGRLRGMN